MENGSNSRIPSLKTHALVGNELVLIDIEKTRLKPNIYIYVYVQLQYIHISYTYIIYIYIIITFFGRSKSTAARLEMLAHFLL